MIFDDRVIERIKNKLDNGLPKARRTSKPLELTEQETLVATNVGLVRVNFLPDGVSLTYQGWPVRSPSRQNGVGSINYTELPK